MAYHLADTAALLVVNLALTVSTMAAGAGRHPVPREHPRLLGSRERLARLAGERQEAYRRMAAVARRGVSDDHAAMISMGLVAAIEDDAALGRRAVERALAYVGGPIKRGHIPFGHDLARCALVYDLCHPWWSDDERSRFHGYVDRTVAANRQSETHVFHNGWYGYKQWGIGLASYASYHENERAPGYLADLAREYRERAAPALELAGAGGGWAEGYYINYWLYEWLFYCEVARHCAGVDHYRLAPSFYRQRAVASMFEAYPGIREYGSRRPVPMGDGGGRVFGGDRDKALAARRILVNRFRDDTDHQAVHTFNETTPRASVGNYAYKDFLWRDATVTGRPLRDFRLSHYSPGAGHVHARSSWDEDATYFFLTCADRFTAHQHLDVGHFVIYKHEELAGDGGHYDGFGTRHDVNYHLRTIAHSTILVHDPAERWPGIRAGPVTGNDGGQAHAWPHHNGAVVDPEGWNRQRELYDIADIATCEDHGEYLYVAADCTRAYSPAKLASFTRQVVFLRPGTFIILDRVEAQAASYRKTWLVQAMRVPVAAPPGLVVTKGRGRLSIQTLLPREVRVEFRSGEALYRYGGEDYPPARDTGPAPACRVEISPVHPARTDLFLHVLTATDASAKPVPAATAEVAADRVTVAIGAVRIDLLADRLGGSVTIAGHRRSLPSGR